MKKRQFARCLAVLLAAGAILAGCSRQGVAVSSGAEPPAPRQSSGQAAGEAPAGGEESSHPREDGKVHPDPGQEVAEPQSSPDSTAPAHTPAEYRERYPDSLRGDGLEGVIRFYVVDAQGSPVQNARLGFTSEATCAEAARLDAEMGTDYGPGEDFAVRIDAQGVAQAGLIAFDPTTGQLLRGLPWSGELRITQRGADGRQTDTTQWVTLTWENTVPGYTVQIDQPNAYAAYAGAEDRVRLVLTRDGEPAPGVFVKLQSRDRRETPDYGGLNLDKYTGFTDRDGVLYLTGLADGGYRVYAGTIARQQEAADITVTAENRAFELELSHETEG